MDEPLRRAVFVAVLLFLSVSVSAFSDEREEFARQAGLDSDLVGLIQLDVGGTQLTVVFVFINERALGSRISPALQEELFPYVGKNAIYVNPNIREVASRFDFSPLQISVGQGGEVFTPTASDWVELTPGFLSGTFAVNPLGPEHGSGSEGILVLEDAIDPTLPFTLSYMGETAEFSIASSAVSAVAPSHEPVEVNPLSDTASLADLFASSDFSSEGMAALLGIDPDYVQTLSVPVQGGELKFLFVLLVDRVRDSRLDPGLIERLEPLIGTGAVLTVVFSPSGAPFKPWDFYVKQGGTNYFFFSDASFVELTEGFIRSGRVGAGEVAAGVIRLQRWVDPAIPFSIFFGPSGVSFP